MSRKDRGRGGRVKTYAHRQIHTIPYGQIHTILRPTWSHTQRERDTHRHIPTIPCPTWSHTHRHTDTHTHRHIAANRRVLQVNARVSFLQVNVRMPFNLTTRCLQSFPERPLVGRPPHQFHFDYSRCTLWTRRQRTAGGG